MNVMNVIMPSISLSDIIIGSFYEKMYFKHYPNGPYKCSICGKLLNRNDEDEIFFVTYVPSKSKDNIRIIDNLQLVCKFCKMKGYNEILRKGVF